MAVGADQHSGLSVPEDVVLFQQTCRERKDDHNPNCECLETQAKHQANSRKKSNADIRLTSASVEDADASVSAVVDLVPPQGGVAVCLDPHPGHGVVKDLIVLDEAQTWYDRRRD